MDSLEVETSYVSPRNSVTGNSMNSAKRTPLKYHQVVLPEVRIWSRWTTISQCALLITSLITGSIIFVLLFPEIIDFLTFLQGGSEIALRWIEFVRVLLVVSPLFVELCLGCSSILGIISAISKNRALIFLTTFVLFAFCIGNFIAAITSITTLLLFPESHLSPIMIICWCCIELVHALITPVVLCPFFVCLWKLFKGLYLQRKVRRTSVDLLIEDFMFPYLPDDSDVAPNNDGGLLSQSYMPPRTFPATPSIHISDFVKTESFQPTENHSFRNLFF